MNLGMSHFYVYYCVLGTVLGLTETKNATILAQSNDGIFRVTVSILKCYWLNYVKIHFIFTIDVCLKAKIIEHVGWKKDGNALILSDCHENHSVLLNVFYSRTIPVNLFRLNDSIIFRKNKRFRESYFLNERTISRKTYPATSFTIIVSSNEILKATLEYARDSVSWNHGALFLLIDLSSGNSCQMAREFLSTAWDFNILFAVYICRHMYSQLMLYTFNPYAKSGTEFWKIIETDYTWNETWTLLQHPIELPSVDESSFLRGMYIYKTRINWIYSKYFFPTVNFYRVNFSHETL